MGESVIVSDLLNFFVHRYRRIKEQIYLWTYVANSGKTRRIKTTCFYNTS